MKPAISPCRLLRLGPDGSLYAATLPSGKVYKLNPAATEKQDDSSATVVFDLAKESGDKADESKPESKSDDDKDGKPDNKSDKGDSKKDVKSHYIWDLTFDTAGKLYIATGGPGAVYRVNPAKPSAAPEQFFKSDEQHIRCLAWDAKGNLIAGSDGSGLVYRINPQGKGYVLFDAPRREITSVAVSSNGTIYAASVGDKSRNPLPPLPVQGTGMVTFTVVQPGSLQVANQSVSVPEGTEIYALQEGQAPRKIWSGKDEVVYALAARPDGLLALTGNRGRVFRIQDDGTYSPTWRTLRPSRASASPLMASRIFSSAPATPASSTRSGRRRSTSTPATCSTPAPMRALAASRSSPARTATRS